MGLEAVVQLAEELVEQIALSADMPVAATSSCLVVHSAGEIVLDCGTHPDVACGCDPVVFGAPIGNVVTLAGGSGDRCRAGIRLEGTGVRETVGVVAHFGQEACTRDRS